jgi:hypothetical protein
MNSKCMTIVNLAVCLVLVAVCGCQKTSREDIISYQMQVGNKVCSIFSGVQAAGEVRFKKETKGFQESDITQSAAAGWRDARSELLNDWRKQLEVALSKFNASVPSNHPPECSELHNALMESARLTGC